MTTVDEMKVVMDAETARLFRKLNEADRRMAQFQAATQQKLKAFDGYFRSAGMAAGALTGALGTRSILEYANAWTRTERAITASEDVFGMRLRSARELVPLANAARIAVEDYAKVYIRTAAAIRDYGHSEAVAAKMTSALSMALKLGSATASEQASVLLQFSQALQKGKLDGDEFRSVMENAGVVQELLADRLKVSKGEIISMAAEGKLRIKDLVGAMVDGYDKIERIFKRAPATIDESMVVLRNSMQRYVGDLDKATGASGKLVGALTWTANNIDTVGNSALVMGAALLAAFGPRVVLGAGLLATSVAAAAGPIGMIAGLIAGGTAAIGLFGDEVALTANKSLTLKDVSIAIADTIASRLTPEVEDATRRVVSAAGLIQGALDGVSTSVERLKGGVRLALNAVAQLFVAAAKTIMTTVLTLPRAVAEAMVNLANEAISAMETLVSRMAEIANSIPGINIDPKINFGRLPNPWTGATEQWAREMKDAGKALGRDYVSEFEKEVEDRAAEIARMRQTLTRDNEREIKLKVGKPPIDKELLEKMRKAWEETQEVYKKALDAAERYREGVVAEYEKELRKFDELLKKKLISQEQYEKTRKNLQIIAQKEMLEALEKEFKNLREVTDAVSSNMASAFDEFTQSGKFSFKKFTASVLADLARIAFKLMVLRPLFGDNGKGFGLFGDLFGNLLGFNNIGIPGQAGLGNIPGLANGGQVDPGRLHIVGERGPELFVPNLPGRIIPTHMAGGGGVGGGSVSVSMPVTIDARGSDLASVERLRAEFERFRAQQPGMIVRTVREASARKMLG